MSCFPILFKENWVRRLRKKKKEEEYSQKSINVIVLVLQLLTCIQHPKKHVYLMKFPLQKFTEILFLSMPIILVDYMVRINSFT